MKAELASVGWKGQRSKLLGRVSPLGPVPTHWFDWRLGATVRPSGDAGAAVSGQTEQSLCCGAGLGAKDDDKDLSKTAELSWEKATLMMGVQKPLRVISPQEKTEASLLCP